MIIGDLARETDMLAHRFLEKEGPLHIILGQVLDVQGRTPHLDVPRHLDDVAVRIDHRLPRSVRAVLQDAARGRVHPALVLDGIIGVVRNGNRGRELRILLLGQLRDVVAVARPVPFHFQGKHVQDPEGGQIETEHHRYALGPVRVHRSVVPDADEGAFGVELEILFPETAAQA
jgi:hypothetical protein